MRALPQLPFIGLLLMSVASCGIAAPNAEEVLAKAQAAATAEHKNIWLRFDASW